MRLVATEYLSLDGVFEEPGMWSHPFFDEEASRYKWDELQASDALLLGRKTYEGFAAAWPTMADTGEFGEKMNGITKYVVSSTLDRVGWTGSVLLQGDPVEAVRELKAKPGNDLVLAGSGQLFNTLMEADLIDLYRIMLHPIVLGKGPRLFADGVPQTILELTETRRLPKGIVILEYRPVDATAA